MPHSSGTRERLLEAAIAILDEGGEAAVRVDRVAELAGITKPSLYHFFADRDGLVVAAMAERYKRALDTKYRDLAVGISACSSQEDFARLLRALVASLAGAEGALRREVRTQVLGASISRPALQKAVMAVVSEHAQALADVLQTAKDRGWITQPTDVYVMSVWWLGTIQGRHFADRLFDETESLTWNWLTGAAIETLLFGRPLGELPPAVQTVKDTDT